MVLFSWILVTYKKYLHLYISEKSLVSVAEFLRTKDFIWRFESINILFEGTVFLELASSVISQLRYTRFFL